MPNKKANSDDGHSNSNSEDSPDLRDLGWYRVSNKVRAQVVRFVHDAMIYGDEYAVVRKNSEWSDDRFNVIVLDCTTIKPEVKFGLLLVGWKPGNRLTAAELENLVWTIGQTGSTCEEMATKLRDAGEAKTILTSGAKRRMAADEMMDELDTIANAVWPVVNSLKIPCNWRGAIPSHAIIYASEAHIIPKVN